MRLLALTTSYPLRPDATAGVFVHRLYQHFPSEWSIEVLCPDDTARAYAETAGNLRVMPVRYAPKPWQTLSQAPGGIAAAMSADRGKVLLAPFLISAMLFRCLSRCRGKDAIHANWALCGAIAAIVGRLMGKPVITTLRGDDVVGAKRSKLAKTILSLAVKGSDAVVCVSDAMADDLKQCYPGSGGKIFVCRNGVEPSFLQVEKKLGTRGELRIVAVGSLIRRKGFDVLISALGGMREAFSARIIGDGPEKHALANLTEQFKIREQVVFCGEVPPRQIPAVLSEADVFVLASRSEGRPNVVVEALAAGVPVVSTDLPGVRGLIQPGTNGWVVPVDDSRALGDALREAAADHMRLLSMGRAARERILVAGETWSGAANQYADIIRLAVDARGGKS